MSFITTKNITKEYPMGKTIVKALKGIDLNIGEGEYLCVAGPSGAGKSTLLNILGLLDEPTAGELIFDNARINGMNRTQLHNFRKARIAFIFQSFNLISVLNAYENIEFPLLLKKIDKKERQKRITKLAQEVGIADYLKHRPDELSGGQMQRVAIVRALVTKPKLVLADEPTANLDSATGKIILDIMRVLNKEEKVTFIIASHDHAIRQQADRTIHIIDGLLNEK